MSWSYTPGVKTIYVITCQNCDFKTESDSAGRAEEVAKEHIEGRCDEHDTNTYDYKRSNHEVYLSPVTAISRHL